MDIDKIIKVIEYIGASSNSSTFTLHIFLQLSISILFQYFIRLIFILKTNRISLFNKSFTNIRKKSMILNHIGLEIIMTFIISFIILSLIKSKPSDIIINMMFAPFIGLIISLCIDNWYLIPKEAEKGLINEQGIKVNSLDEMAEIVDEINQEMIESDQFRPIVAKSINDIKRVQKEHEQKIDSINDKCDSSIELLMKLQESEKNDKKLSLKKAMYDCLARGFIIPEEREKIEVDYYSYTHLLNGNSDVQDLYENHYKKLKIHEDRRKRNIPVENDRRKSSNCTYGQYDKEKEESK